MINKIWSILRDERGNVSFGGATTQKRKVAGPSPQEQAIAAANAQLAARQAEYIQRAAAEQEAFAASPQGQQLAAIEQAALRNIVARQGGQIISPEEQALINQVYAPQQAEAENRLRQLAQEQASLRGMAISDSPIGSEYLREVGRIGQHFGGQRAQAAFQRGDVAQQQAMALAQFQQNLRQQNLQNRLMLGQAQTSGLPLQSLLQQGRVAAAPVTLRQAPKFGVGASDLFGNQGLVGGLLGAYKGYKSGLA